MGISLENLFMSNKSIHSSQAGGANQAQSVNSAVNQLLQNMFSQGDVISGKVSGLQGNVVELLLPNGQNLSALLGENVQVNLGEQMLFAVKGMNANQMELNPLFTNTANTTTIMKALEGASLPANEQNVAIVQNMMERGMSIQKDALLAMKRSVAQFPQASVEDVVTLHSLKMPVTESNLTQLAAYKNSENQIMGPIKEMLSEIPNTFDVLMDTGETGKAVALYKDLLKLFSDMPEVVKGETNLENVVEKPENGVQDIPANEDNLNKVSAGEKSMPLETPKLADNGALSQDTTKQLLVKFGFENDQIEAILKDATSVKDVLKVISNKVDENPTFTEEKLADIFKDPVFKLFMKEAGEEASTLAPKDVAHHENIDNLYEHLQKRADKILETLAGKEDLSIAKSAQNLKANVDFMNQMNQMFQYVQLPLKFSESRANGELYVYGNGKKLSLEDGDVSALLHLDMEHLGTVDIHVEMNKEKQVKTNFYFEDEAMLDFVYENIDMLNERLEKRGYGPITNVQMKDDATKTPVSEIFETKNETPILLKTQAFDARI